MPVAKVILDLVTTKFGKGLKDTEKKWKRWKKSIFSVKNALGAIFMGAIARKVIAFGATAVDAYEQQEIAVRNLADALVNAGEKSRGAIADMQKFAGEIQNITTIGDETTLGIMKLGAAMGGVTGKELKAATIAAIGLSKGFGISLESAMRNMMKTQSGLSGELGEIIPQLKDAKDGQEMFNIALKIGTENFRIATGEVETATGKLQQWKNLYGDIVKENLGRGIAEAFREAGIEISKAIAKGREWNTEWSNFMALKVKEELLNIAAGFLYIASAIETLRGVFPSGLRMLIDLVGKGDPFATSRERLGRAAGMYETAGGISGRAALAGREAEFAEFRAKHRGALKEVEDVIIKNTEEMARSIKSRGRNARK